LPVYLLFSLLVLLGIGPVLPDLIVIADYQIVAVLETLAAPAAGKRADFQKE